MRSSQKTCLLHLFGVFLLCGGVLAKTKITDPSKIFVQTPASTQHPEQQITTNLAGQQPASGISTYPETYRVTIDQIDFTNYTGIRSVFQWTIGNLSNIGGIHNALDFFIDDAVNLQSLSGQIGIFTNDSRVGVHFSLDSIESSTPGANFTCSNNFTLINGTHACFNSNYTLISNAIYYLDVEIQNKTVRGYISVPQSNRSDIFNTNLKRILIGEINWKNELKDLRPFSYWVANSNGDSCKSLSEISTYNFPPVSYKADPLAIKIVNRFYSSSDINTTNCGPQNVIALSNWSNGVVVYISRPPAIIDATGQTSA